MRKEKDKTKVKGKNTKNLVISLQYESSEYLAGIATTVGELAPRGKMLVLRRVHEKQRTVRKYRK